MELFRNFHVIADNYTGFVIISTESEMAILEVSKGPHCPLLTYEELNVATEGFRPDHFLGEGGFGRVYKGVVNGTNQVGSCASGKFNSCKRAVMFYYVLYPDDMLLLMYYSHELQRS